MLVIELSILWTLGDLGEWEWIFAMSLLAVHFIKAQGNELIEWDPT